MRDAKVVGRRPFVRYLYREYIGDLSGVVEVGRWKNCAKCYHLQVIASGKS